MKTIEISTIITAIQGNFVAKVLINFSCRFISCLESLLFDVLFFFAFFFTSVATPLDKI